MKKLIVLLMVVMFATTSCFNRKPKTENTEPVDSVSVELIDTTAVDSVEVVVIDTTSVE